MAAGKPGRESPLGNMARRMAEDVGVIGADELDDESPPPPLPPTVKRTWDAVEDPYWELKQMTTRDRVDLTDVLNRMLAKLVADGQLYEECVEGARQTAVLRARWKEWRRRNG